MVRHAGTKTSAFTAETPPRRLESSGAPVELTDARDGVLSRRVQGTSIPSISPCSPSCRARRVAVGGASAGRLDEVLAASSRAALAVRNSLDPEKATRSKAHLVYFHRFATGTPRRRRCRRHTVFLPRWTKKNPRKGLGRPCSGCCEEHHAVLSSRPAGSARVSTPTREGGPRSGIGGLAHAGTLERLRSSSREVGRSTMFFGSCP